MKHLVSLYMVREECEKAVFEVDDERIAKESEIKTVFDRFYNEMPGGYEDVQRKCETDYSHLEWQNVLSALSEYMEKSLHVNPSWTVHKSKRITYFHHARQAKLKMPRLVISNWPEDAFKKLRAKLPDSPILVETCSYRPEKFPFWYRLIDEKIVESDSKRYNQVPFIYRSWQQPLYDLRVYVVGKQLFAIKIDSQQFEDTKHDWRANQEHDFYSETTVSKELTEKILSLATTLNYTFFSLDFTVVSEETDPLLIEVFARPDWIFIEKRTKTPITAALGDLIISGKN